MKKYIFMIVVFFLLMLGVLIYRELEFTIDIARDFLLLDLLSKGKIMLIGARTSSQGLFHGPLWLYINLPIFVLSNGNPNVLFMWWILLFIGTLVATYFITKYLFDRTAALGALLLLIPLLPIVVENPTNPYGAILCMPFFYYLITQYLTKGKPLFLILAYICIGFIIHFELFLGVPLFILTSLYITPLIIKKKQFIHFFCMFGIFIPLSTYILFDIRHNFLQTNALIRYFTDHSGGVYIDQYIASRVRGFFMSILITNSLYAIVSNALILFVIVYAAYKRKWHSLHLYAFPLFIFFGFWILSFATKNAIEWYYYAPFSIIMMMLFAASYKAIPKKIYVTFFIIILVAHCIPIFLSIKEKKTTTVWSRFYYLAKDANELGGNSYGYFANSHDQVSNYPILYSMKYVTKNSTDTIEGEKKRKTLLISSQLWKNTIDTTYFVKHNLKITSKPKKIVVYPDGFKIEIYELNSKELAVKPEYAVLDPTSFR